MDIDDIKIKIVKYDRERNHVIANIIVSDIVEIRGYILRYTTTKHSPIHPVWVVTPPAMKGRNKIWFHIVRIKDPALWEQIQARFVVLAKEHTDLL